MRRAIAKVLRAIADGLDAPAKRREISLPAKSERLAEAPQHQPVTDGVSLQRPANPVGRWVPGDSPHDGHAHGGGAWLYL